METGPDTNTIYSLREQATSLLQSGNAPAAEEVCREALGEYPYNPDLRCVLGMALTAQGRPIKAAQVLRRVVNQFPRIAKAHAELANALLALQKPVEALEHYQRAIAISPTPLSADAMTSLRCAVELQSENADAWRLLGEACAKNGMPADAIDAYEKGLQLDPENGPLLSLLGNELKTVGRPQDAIQKYESCISLYPTVGEVYYSLANLKTYRFDDSLLARMAENVANEELSDEARVNFHFAIGKAYEDRNDFEQAFHHYELGNTMRRKHEHYNTLHSEQMLDRVTSVFRKELIEGRSATDNSSDATPIFIVGLPRSGSTLLEQILASHSEVEGTHELAELGRILRRLAVPNADRKSFPEIFQDLSDESLEQLGRQYLQATQQYRSGNKYFVDKMPNNFLYAGAIKLILPHAKIINARRHPLGSCVSTFKQLFYDGQSYSYDLDELAQYYLIYQKLMDHWHTVLPDFVLDVRYEDVVNEQEQQTRRLLDFCGLPFEEECLSFYETDRAISTASSEQVRQPIYKDSLEGWRSYEPYISTLIQGLEPVLPA